MKRTMWRLAHARPRNLVTGQSDLEDVLTVLSHSAGVTCAVEVAAQSNTGPRRPARFMTCVVVCACANLTNSLSAPRPPRTSSTQLGHLASENVAAFRIYCGYALAAAAPQDATLPMQEQGGVPPEPQQAL